jgi:hypothetical protein
MKQPIPAKPATNSDGRTLVLLFTGNTSTTDWITGTALGGVPPTGSV